MKQSLFGHLAFGFSQSPENLATEALCYILDRSETAKKAFVRFISQADTTLSSNLKFETQIHTSSNSSDISKEESNNSGAFRPDFAGKDNTNKYVVIGETKFWAGLTDNQPVTYLKNFPESSVLIFIAPSKRLSLLWPELIRRCKESGLDYQQTTTVNDEFRFTTIGSYPTLAITSWRKIINAMQHAVEADSDTGTLSDILQLQGLCDRMDETAFLPIQSEELTSDIGRRILQYCDLVDEITETLVNSGVASTKGLQKASWSGVTLRSMVIHNYGCQLQFNSEFWVKYGRTPIWFNVKKTGTGKYWSFAQEVKAGLIKFEMEEPPRLIQDGDSLLVPLFIPTSAEKTEVMKSLLKQIQEVIDILATL